MKKKFAWISLAALTALTCVAFVGCEKEKNLPADLTAAEKKMRAAGYDVEVDLVDEYSSEYYPVGCVGEFEAEKGMTFVEAYFFEDVESAKAFHKSEEGKEVGMSVQQEGKWVYWGFGDALEDFTK